MTILASYLGIAYESPEEKILRLLIELGAQFVEAAEGSLLVLDREKSELVFAMTIGSDLSEEILVGQRVPLGQGIVGLAAQTHEVQIGAPTFRIDQPKGLQTKAVLAAPMLIDDELIGVITAVSFESDQRFSSDDALLYGRIAAVAGVVVEQRRRLAIARALEEGSELPAAISEEEQLEFEIIDRVRRLVRSKPEAKIHIAKLLAQLESLVGTDEA